MESSSFVLSDYSGQKALPAHRAYFEFGGLVCTCDCHRPGSMTMHCVPCCDPSPCGLGITRGMLDTHIDECELCKVHILTRALAESKVKL